MTPLCLLQAGTIPANAKPVIGGVAIAYFVIVALIGIYATRKTKSAAGSPRNIARSRDRLTRFF